MLSSVLSPSQHFSIFSSEPSAVQLFYCLNAYNLDRPLKRFFAIFLAFCPYLFGPWVVFPRLFFPVTKLCLRSFASLHPRYLLSISSACCASFFVSRPFVLFHYTTLFLSSFLSSSFHPLARPLSSHLSHRSISFSHRSRLLTYPLMRSHSSLSCHVFDSVVRPVLPSHCLPPGMTLTNGDSS
jgi:hypothetical protein